MTYTEYVLRLSGMLGVDAISVNAATVIPLSIDQAEQRIYRDLDLISTTVRQNSTVTANSRNYTLPSASGTFVVVDEINVFTPVSTTTTRNPVVPVSLSFLNRVWPTDTAASASTVPEYFAMVTDQTVVFGPPPGAAFTAEVVGRVRPNPLTSTNATTWLSTNLPDLMLAAAAAWSAIYLSGTSGAAGMAPGSAVAYEADYQMRLKSADAESARRRFAGASWTSQRVEPTALPQRG